MTERKASDLVRVHVNLTPRVSRLLDLLVMNGYAFDRSSLIRQAVDELLEKLMEHFAFENLALQKITGEEARLNQELQTIFSTIIHRVNKESPPDIQEAG